MFAPVRQSPGIYNQGGRTVYSANRPGMRPAVKPKPAVAAPAATPAATPAPAAPATDPAMMNAFTGNNGGNGSSVGNTLYPGQRPFEPTNYEGSPLYKFQRDEGLAQLNKLYASRGLTGSGAEVAGNQKFLANAGAQEAQRASGVAQNEADRLERIQQNESIRLQNDGNEKWNRLYQTLGLMMSQNPMSAAYQAGSGLSDLSTKEGSSMANYLASMYPRSSGGGGGGGGSTMPFVPPQPSGPNMSNVNQANFLSNAYQGANNTNFLSTFLSSVL